MTTTSSTPPHRRRFRRRLIGLGILLALGLAGLWAARGGRPVAEPAGAIDLDLGAWANFAFSPDGRTLAFDGVRILLPEPAPNPPAMAGHQQFVRLRDLATGRAGASFDLDACPYPQADGPRPILFSPDGSILVAGNWLDPRDPPLAGSPVAPPMLRAWEVGTGKVLATLPLPAGWGRQAAFAADGRTLTASRGDAAGEQVIQWSTADWHQVAAIRLPSTNGVNATALAPAGDLAALASYANADIRLYDLPSGRLRGALSQPQLRGTFRSFVEIRFAPDGATLAALCGDNTVQFWDVATATLRASYVPRDLRYQAYMTFAPDGQTLALYDAHDIHDGPLDRLHRWAGLITGWQSRPVERVGQVHLIGVATGRPLGSFAIPQPSPSDFAFTPDGRTLATYGADVSVPPQTKHFPTRLLFWRLDRGGP